MSMVEAVQQRKATDDVNARSGNQFKLLQGIKRTSTPLASWISPVTRRRPLTSSWPPRIPGYEGARIKTDRMLAAVAHPAVRILAHSRARITGSRAGVIANWDAVFTSAAERRVAIEIDGDPSRQDLDHTLAAGALEAGCLFALDSDAHTTTQLSFAETALAHARLAGIPAERIVNCWPLDRLLAWLSNPLSERRP
jgi:hypothetical protein